MGLKGLDKTWGFSFLGDASLGFMASGNGR